MLSIGIPMKNVEAIIVDEKYNILPKGKRVNYVFPATRYLRVIGTSRKEQQLSFFEKNIQWKNPSFLSYRRFVLL